MGVGQQRTAAQLVETAVVSDSNAPMSSNESASRETLPAVKTCIPTPFHSSHEFSLAKRVAENAEAPVGESLSFCQQQNSSLFWPGTVPGADAVRVAGFSAVVSVSQHSRSADIFAAKHKNTIDVTN